MMNDAAWTPGRGIVRGVIVGFAVAVALSVLLAPVAMFAPTLLINGILRASVTFGVAWIIFAAVHSAAGMVGGPLTSIAVLYSACVMFSNHVVWAVAGAPVGDAGELVTGWQYWFAPSLLGVLSLMVVIPLMFCAALCRDGVPGSDFFSWLSTRPIWFSRGS